jgi:hypothetical protein
VQGAQRACADEIEHARIAFGLASAYADRPMGPGGLDVRGALDENLDAIGVACGVARDRARDPVVKRVLARSPSKSSRTRSWHGATSPGLAAPATLGCVHRSRA